MRESFVVHAEYIEDLPEENKKEYLWYCYNYGINSIEPELESFEKTVWTKIKRRIDVDSQSYENQKLNNKIWKAKSHYKNNRASEEEIKLLESVGFLGSPKNLPPYTNTHSVYVNDTVSVIDNVNDNVIESVYVSDTVSDAQQSYADKVYDLFSSHSLPCCNNNKLSFMQKDFRLAKENIKGIHSDDVLAAVNNYIDVLEDPLCYYKHKHSFDSFTASKMFRKFLPENFKKENFLSFGTAKKENDGMCHQSDMPRGMTPEEFLASCQEGNSYDNQ